MVTVRLFGGPADGRTLTLPRHQDHIEVPPVDPVFGLTEPDRLDDIVCSRTIYTAHRFGMFVPIGAHPCVRDAGYCILWLVYLNRTLPPDTPTPWQSPLADHVRRGRPITHEWLGVVFWWPIPPGKWWRIEL
jgi:hypothetical protein